MSPDTDEPSDTALTQADITALGAVIDETEAHTAWSLVDDDEPEPRWWTPARITAAGVVAAVLAIGVAAVVAVPHLNGPTLGDVAMVEADWTAETQVPEVGPSGFDIPPPPPPPTVTVTQPPTLIPAPQPQSAYNQITPEALAALDRQFIVNIRGAGWAVWDPVLMAQRAHQVCAMLSNGTSPQYVAQQIAVDSGLEPGMAISMGQSFVATTMSTYPACP